ncbi:hypothetical protein G4H71_16235 [Rhodococcus triatomae]|uniref:SPW repeat-containing protein n=1 Tax=Rhodococcus triatomae TaxID=300028 RepID=A0A1G8JI36_9NOCA|nr:SPW repeat protein [Rhodococcus triatomae]QNG19710.1 hypothetical protein G4H72_14140 [Rhodococcus triatomae]QNG24374.1 hypothetical protein G4H71_16235 [Rhodococcus triatomae]SDI30898.1 SPW repeat-containing protein [Rhodococcus triatomae]
MRSWSRIQDVAAVVLGVYAALSPIWLDTNNAARWSLIVLGVLVALAGVAHMYRPELSYAEYGMAVLGVLMFIAPWAMNFHAMSGAAWTAWVVGVLTVVVAVTGLPVTNSLAHRQGGMAAHH